MLALPLSCATQQREPTLERASGTGGTAADLHSTNKLPLATSEPTLEAAVRIMNVSPGRFLVEARAPVDVATTATLERRSEGGQWVPVRYELRESCAPPAGGVPACRPLAPGARFAPLSWNGTSCGPCCNAEEPTPIEPGAYRLKLSACNDGGVHWEGPSFDMPAATDAVERARATSSVRSISLYRLGGTPPERQKIADDGHIAGYPILSATEIALPESLVRSLIDWLRNPGGFSDAVMRRCFPGKRFGFRLDRDVPGIGSERSDIAVDLGCQFIVVENQEGSLRSRSYTYFDSSREALLTILGEAMPAAVSSKPRR